MTKRAARRTAHLTVAKLVRRYIIGEMMELARGSKLPDDDFDRVTDELHKLMVYHEHHGGSL